MNKLKLYYAVITACVGILGLGSCNQDDTTYQGLEKNMSRLKVMTRSIDETTKPKEGKIYIFNPKGLCTDTISPENLKNNTPITTNPGEVKLIAIGSDDLSAYNLPSQSTVTDSSIIKLNSGRALTDLILGTTTTTLEEGETTQSDITMSREVICIKDIIAHSIPDDIIGTEMMIGPMYKHIRLNGKYTTDIDSIRIALKKKTQEEGVWTYTGDSVFSYPSKGNPSVILRLKTVDNTKEYTYQSYTPLKKNHFVKLNVDFREGIKTFLVGSLSSPSWEGTDSIAYQYQKADNTKDEPVKHPMAGSSYYDYYVVSVDKSKRTVVLLRRKHSAGITNESMMNALSKSINKPAWAVGGWRLPTVEECRYFLTNATLYDASATNNTNFMVEPGTYYCTKDNELMTLTLSGSTKRTITENAFTGYSPTIFFRPVIDVSY